MTTLEHINKKQITKSNFDKIVDFHKAYGLVYNEYFNTNIFLDDPKTVELRYKLINEEIKELFDAFEQQDFIEVIDALTDILYVVYGAGASFGVNMNNIFENLKMNDSNFEKVIFMNYKNNNFTKISDFKIKKDIFKDLSALEIFNLKFLNPLKEKDTELYKLTYESNDLEKNIRLFKIKNCLKDILNLTYHFGAILNINMNKSYEIVHNSNMSKLCLDKELAIKTVKNYKDNDERYDTPNYRKSGCDKYYVVYNESTGKILKSLEYTPANFEKLLNY